ncbi:MAG: DUF4150 domain-containing protein [Tabrizicola sp.]
MSVFANGLEVSGKATPNKTLAAMPDVCMSPPPPPAGPVPIPYPMFGFASDTTDGCTSVFVKGKEAGKKNSTKYSKTTGNEPATNSFGANISSHKITGPLRFAAYSFDVIFEGGGATRFTDLTTQNHMNSDGLSAGVDIGQPASGSGPPDPDCKALKAMNTAFRRKHNKKVIKTTKKKGKKTKKTTFKQSGTVCHGKISSGSSSTTVMGTSATGQLESAGVEGQCPPVDTRAKVPGAGGKMVKNPRLFKVKNKAFKEKPKGKDTRNKLQKKKELSRIKHDICGGKCDSPSGGFHAHAELNVFNCVAKMQAAGTLPKDGSAKVLLAINWNSSKGPRNPNPCDKCKEVIDCLCKPENKCIQIEICDENGQKADACSESKGDTP